MASKISPDSSQQQVRAESKIEEDSGTALVQWKNAHADLFAEIKTRHYSPKTLKSYALWARKFQVFTQNKAPHLLSSSDVKEFLRYLAIKQNVSASTQSLC